MLGLVGFGAMRESTLLLRAVMGVALTGLGCAAIALFVVLRQADLDDFSRISEFSTAFAAQGGGLEKLRLLGKELVGQASFLVSLVLGLKI